MISPNPASLLWLQLCIFRRTKSQCTASQGLHSEIQKYTIFNMFRIDSAYCIQTALYKMPANMLCFFILLAASALSQAQRSTKASIFQQQLSVQIRDHPFITSAIWKGYGQIDNRRQTVVKTTDREAEESKIMQNLLTSFKCLVPQLKLFLR